MKSRHGVFFAAWLTCVCSGYAGEGPKYVSAIPSVDLLSSSLRLPHQTMVNDDSVTGEGSLDPNLWASPAAKSPWLAGGMSFVIPGTGEYYSESYLKSALFFAIEVAGWIVAYSHDKKGDRQTDIFQNYADAHWSVVEYAQWMNTYRSTNVFIDPNTSLPPWHRVNWAELNSAERQVATGPEGRGFTHTLPLHGEQQYYELIGKYHQYSSGWDDYTSGEDFFALSPRFSEYSAMRGKANDYYTIASTAVSVVVVNHIISAFDAYFTAAGHNKSIGAEARMNLRHTPWGPVAETVGTVRFQF